MQRRTFLSLLGLGGAAAATASMWTATPFSQDTALGQDTARGQDDAKELSLNDHLQRAGQQGKPLLVVVIPVEDGAKLDRGRLVAALLQHGTDATLADLALTSVVCATGADVDASTGKPSTAGTAPLVLLERIDDPDRTDDPTRTGNGVRSTRIESDITEYPVKTMRGETLATDADAKEQLTTWQKPLAAALHAALVGTPELRRRRASEAARVLSEAERAQLPKLLSGAVPASDGLVTRAAAAFRAHDIDNDTSRFTKPLAEHTRATCVAAPPAGARWAIAGGCGTQIEGVQPAGPMAGCGMGHVPEPAKRFVWLFAQDA